jgi:hypothetical protein
VSNGLLQQWPKVEKGLAALVDCMDLPTSTLTSAAATEEKPEGEAGSGSKMDNSRYTDTTNKAAMPSAAAAAAVGNNGDADAESGGCGPGAAGQVIPWQGLFQQVMGDSSRAAAHEVPLTGGWIRGWIVLLLLS